MTVHKSHLNDLRSDAVTLSDLCILAERIACEKPEWELTALIVSMGGIASKIATGLDTANFPKEVSA